MKLISRKGVAVDVPDDQVQSAFQSGQYGLPPGAQLPMVGEDGIGYVAAHDAAAAFAQGQRLAAPAEVEKAQRAAQYGGIAGGAIAGAEGLARGATFGLSDPLAVAVGGEETRKHLQGYKEENPYASGAGEIAGAVLPMLASGGAAAPEEAINAGRIVRSLGAIPRGAAALGDLAGGAVARGLGEGMLSRIASTAASGAVQGGIASAGMAVSDAELGNTELSGEKLLAAVGHGALLGGATGGALQGAGEFGSYVLGRLHPHLTGIAEEQAFRSINARKAFTTEASKVEGGAKGIGRQLLDDGVITAGDTVETLAPKIAAGRAESGERVGAVLDAADQAGIKGPSLGRITTRIKDEVLNPLEKFGPLHANVVNETQRALDSLATYAGVAGAERAAAGVAAKESGIGFRELQQFRRQMESRIKDFTAPTMGVPTSTSEALTKVRNILEDEIGAAGDAASKQMGGGFSKAYREAKLTNQRYIVADKAVQDSLIRAQANAAHSLTDKLIGAHGLGAGLMHGFSSAHGGFALGGLQGLAMGAIASKVSKIIRTHGNSTAAVALDRMAALGGIRRAQASVDRQLDRGVAGLFNAKERAAALPKRSALSYNEAVDAVSKAVGSAGGHTAKISGAVAPLTAHAPQATNAFERAALRATSFLASKIPAGHRIEGSLTPQLERPRVSDVEKERFLRYVQAVHDPTVILESMKNGSITGEHVEAIRTVYPELYGEIRQKIMARLQDAKHPMPYAMEFRVRRLFGLPGMDGRMVNLLQQNFSGPPAPKGKGPPNLASAHAPAHPLQDAGKFARLSGLQQETR